MTTAISNVYPNGIENIALDVRDFSYTLFIVEFIFASISKANTFLKVSIILFK